MTPTIENSNQPTAILHAADVLAGRGGKTNAHPGNKLYRTLVKQNRSSYQSLKSNAHKQLLAESIIISIKNRGGRFLKRYGKECNLWIELSYEDALTKTTQALREIPAGTSSRGLNVERLLEHSRQQQLVKITEAADMQPLPLPISSKTENFVPLQSKTSFRDSLDYIYPRKHCEATAFLEEHEIETLISDSDAFEALASLMD